MADATSKAGFFGWRVVAAGFVLAVFGWGLGFYGPPIYLHAVRQARGWSLPLVSAAVTTHFLLGAVVVANLPRLYARFGIANVTKTGSAALAAGVAGWALAQQPWQLFVATLLSGSGWATTGGAAVNAIVSPWFSRARPAALASAYNGSSVGGIVFSPLWVAAIGLLGFSGAAAAIGVVMIATIWLLADAYFAKTPRELGLAPDGDAQGVRTISSASAKPLPGGELWRSWRFITLAAGMALGLFAQIGLLAHLFSLLAPVLGAQLASFAAATATAAAIAGRTLVGWLIPERADRRLFACGSYLIQVAGSLAFLCAAGNNPPLLWLGVALFGFGIGNATSLPPLIAQAELAAEDVARAVPMIVAVSQGAYAFAPAAFGLIRALAPATAGSDAAPHLFIVAGAIFCAAIAAMLLGRRPRSV